MHSVLLIKLKNLIESVEFVATYCCYMKNVLNILLKFFHIDWHAIEFVN